MRFRLAVVALVGVILASACHQHVPQGPQRSLRNVITQEEIDSSNASNVYDLIVRLRADFLKDRGPVSLRSNTHARAVVFLNDQEYGILETMRNIPTGRISQVQYFNGVDAAARFGAQYGGGVVLLVSRVE